jgi:hypothetical protein
MSTKAASASARGAARPISLGASPPLPLQYPMPFTFDGYLYTRVKGSVLSRTRTRLIG